MHNRWTECISIFHLPPKVSATQSHPPPQPGLKNADIRTDGSFFEEVRCSGQKHLFSSIRHSPDVKSAFHFIHISYNNPL